MLLEPFNDSISEVLTCSIIDYLPKQKCKKKTITKETKEYNYSISKHGFCRVLAVVQDEINSHFWMSFSTSAPTDIDISFGISERHSFLGFNSWC